MDEMITKAMERFNNHDWEKAEELFCQVEDQASVASYIKKCRLFQKFSVGASVPYGSWEGKELTWRVLEEKGNMRLLICDGIVSVGAYQQLYVDTYWENASLRKWLNQEFLTGAFSADERRTILSTRIETPANEDFSPTVAPRLWIRYSSSVNRKSSSTCLRQLTGIWDNGGGFALPVPAC